MGWFFGFKLHIVVNEQVELLAFKLTRGNVDDRVLCRGLSGKIFGDRGSISKKLFEELYGEGI